MSTSVLANQVGSKSHAETALKAAAGFWFLVAVIGQWVFLYYIVAFYGRSTFTGNFQAWTKNTFLKQGYIAGDRVGNLVFAAHALLAAVIAFGGAIQLIPQIRARHQSSSLERPVVRADRLRAQRFRPLYTLDARQDAQ